MALNFIILFLTTFLGGMLIYWLGFKSDNLRLPLVFAGAFLFSITVIHILPELFTISTHPMRIGVFVLVGFFFQQLLETFTRGVEHGHFHRGHGSQSGKLGLIIALIIHSLLEGSLLTHGSPFHGQHESYSLLLGIVFHKVPAAFALMAVIKVGDKPRWPELLFLLVFSLASPAGMVFSNYFMSMSQEGLLVLFGIVSGSFLHISSTIFVETSPEHHLGFKRTAVSVAAAILAIAVEFLG